MKAACLTLAMVACAVLFQETSYAFFLSPALQEQSTKSSSKPLSGGHATDVSSAHDGDFHNDRTSSDEHRARRRTSKKNHLHIQTNPIMANRPKQLRNGRERSASENVMNVGRSNSSKSAIGASKVPNNHNLPARTTGVATLSGQQFRNSRNRGAALATVGGPPSSTRNTATISGSSINRKRSN